MATALFFLASFEALSYINFFGAVEAVDRSTVRAVKPRVYIVLTKVSQLSCQEG